MALRDVMAGFLEKGSPEDQYVFPDMPLQNPDDKNDYTEEYGEEKTQAEPVRVVSDALDFLQHVAEDIIGWIERETGEGHKPQDAPAKPLILHTNDLGASDFAVRRYAVGFPGSTPLAFKKAGRKAIRIVNWGPDPVFIAHESIPSFDAAVIPMGVMQVPPSDITIPGEYFPVMLPTQDEVWAIASGANVCTVEVADFFGVDNA